MAPTARGVFRGFALRRIPQKADSSANTGKRGRDDSPPATPSKKARTDAGCGADSAGTVASGVAPASAGDPAPTEVAPATGDAPPATGFSATPAEAEEEGKTLPATPVAPQGPSAPAPEVGATVVDLDSDVEVTGMAEEPEAAPTPSPAAPAAAAAATAAATGTASGDAPAEALEDAATPVVPEEELHRQLEAQRAELQEALDSLVAAQAETKKEHAEVLAAAQARINEKSDLIANYLGEIQGLRIKLEAQTGATESAVDASARHKIQLNAAKDKVARLETERATVQEELAKAGEDNTTQAAELASPASHLRKAQKAAHDARLHHGTLTGQRQLETEKLLKIAHALPF
ncbi:uncharacterized abhydrolase domain-containing protein DDB_G0269086-like [Brachypodium distachyon]|uniref:uncharacterized abhydrolase domain-containing protein DDB_G0269086-like n=1 Tax=Brachypodium distachyon TaxID=15368 RepID=UPI00053004A3|nr:uncharacterized abhydrolase domain-containing protein DDB_G0269086-like [Brachypodium distachyon]|eukprot:XP_010229783.1 uncharacterized abhydrolase domain-containing protein DDB_G0269086-like [Brachypodium distachyon]